MNPLTIIIPNKAGENPHVTLNSLYRQTMRSFDIIIVNDLIENANIARQQGLEMAQTEYVLFSDNDIDWRPDAIRLMYDTLRVSSVSYVYGQYEMDGKIFCNQPFDPKLLRRKNYISTMTMVRRKDHPGFDPDIRRLQDWDVWLMMLKDKRFGMYLKKTLFRTEKREGITFNGIGWNEAVNTIKQKHKI